MRFLRLLSALAAAGMLCGCDDAQPVQAAARPQVTVAEPLVRTIVDWDEFVGRFEPVEHVEVRPRVSGYIVEAHFEEGQRVERGQLLFTIDPRPFEARRDEARGRAAAASARLENARTELERARGLVDIGAVSTEELEALEAAVRTAEAELTAARAAVRAAELDVEFTKVVAPISGRVSYRRVDPGNAVKADETVLTTVVSVDPIHFVFQGSEALYLKYKRAEIEGPRIVRIRLQDERDYRWAGELDFLDNSIDTGSGTIRGRAVVPNPDGFLTPGMFGHMLLQASAEYSGVLLPDSAIATRGADRIVYVVDDEGLVSARTIELGDLHEGLRVIRSGLAAGDRVVVDGQQRVRPGQNADVVLARLEAPGPDGAPVAIVPIDAEPEVADAR
ncbi:MAG TPA: efflux RND transporter periplasmic adaptor subunit [Gammaproteobacteria bacterium]